MDYRVHAGDIPEDQTTALMESYSVKLPTSFFLGAALTSIVGSLHPQDQRERPSCPVHRPMGRPVPSAGDLQQDGQAARLRRPRAPGIPQRRLM